MQPLKAIFSRAVPADEFRLFLSGLDRDYNNDLSSEALDYFIKHKAEELIKEFYLPEIPIHVNSIRTQNDDNKVIHLYFITDAFAILEKDEKLKTMTVIDGVTQSRQIVAYSKFKMIIEQVNE
jgi:hypothetical protein